ncbi:DUF7824 domain-containing protein [Nonomuraea sp. H19]|uniref:DUF7824 domain-containing protein n=1 Tax=Nonomuraea sp. H19 TaxID=3452206 RepID=UPI003F891A70
MTAWDRVVQRIKAGDTGGTIALIADLDPADRKAVAAALPAYLAERNRQTNGWWECRQELGPLLLAGAACISGPAAVTSWLFRREFAWQTPVPRQPERILELMRTRPEAWRSQVAQRMAGRMRLPEVQHWAIVAELVRESGMEPPDGGAFMVGWLRSIRGERVARVAADPLFPCLAPRIFDTDGLDEDLTHSLTETIAGLIDHGALDRAAVIGGAVGRLLRDGPSAIPALAALLDRLSLDLDEAGRHAKDFVRLLPVAPVSVAEMALARLRSLHEAGLLTCDLFGEAAEALAFRPEKKLLRATLSWVGDAVRQSPDRADAGLRALSMIFAQDALPIQAGAARLAVKLARHAGEPGRTAITAAAAGLPAELRELIAAAYGEVAVDAAEPPPVLVAVTVADPAPPIASPAELAFEIASIAWSVPPEQFERILAGLVEWAHREPDVLREELEPWSRPFDPGAFGYHSYGTPPTSVGLLRQAALAFASPDDSRTLTKLFAGLRHQRSNEAAPDRMYMARAREVIALFEDGEPGPVLLATPTAGTGHLDPDVLLDRFERLEAARVRPLPADFQQALLRLPRSVSPEAVARAGRLSSEDGRALAAWLRGGGLPDLASTCEIVTYRSGWPEHWACFPRAELSAPGMELPELIRDLCVKDEKESSFSFFLDWWPFVMPSHREIVAALLLDGLPVFLEDRNGGQVAALARLAHGDGPVGAATAYALTCGMGHRDPAERAGATDALLTLAARGQAPTAELGEAIIELVCGEVVKLNRVTAALEDVVQGGGHAAAWAVIAAALRGLLPGPGQRPRAGVAELLAVGAKAAAAARAQAELPELAVVAARKGSSRLVQEARRLQRILGDGGGIA